MLTEEGTISENALETIAYLSRSPNRIATLDALTNGPATRRELAETMDASRTTLDRIVNELEERGWAERTSDGEYVATPIGRHLMREFRPFAEGVEAIERLGETVAWLPTADLDIDLRHFSDAAVREPDRQDPVDAIDFMVNLLKEADELRSMTHFVPPASFLDVLHDGVTSGRLTFEGVVPAEHVGRLGEDADRCTQWRAIIDAGGELYRYDGPIPCNVWILDELVMVKKSAPGPIDEAYGRPIVSSNAEVLSWAHGLIDGYRADARRVDETTFTSD